MGAFINDDRVLEFHSLDESIIKEIDNHIKNIPIEIWNKTIIGTVLNYVFDLIPEVNQYQFIIMIIVK